MSTLVVITGLAAVLMARPALQQYRALRYVARIERLEGGLYLIQATGMNVAALVTDDGVVLVDTMMSGWWGPAVLDAIRSVTDKPITTIINTHAHKDHIGNVARFSATMDNVVMQENTRFHILRSGVAGDATPGFRKAATFTDRLSLTRGREHIDLYFFGKGHTGGDAWVVFPALRIAHIGDLAWKQDGPRFDRDAGGSAVAYPDTLAMGLAGIPDVDTFIVGHSGDGSKPLMSRRELEAYQRLSARLLSDSRDALRAGRRAADTAARFTAMAGVLPYSAMRVTHAVETIYDELQPQGTVAAARGPRRPRVPRSQTWGDAPPRVPFGTSTAARTP